MRVILSKLADKQYRTLHTPEQAKVKRKLASLAEQPHVGKKLSGDITAFRVLRAWPYRIIYFVNKDKQRIEVRSIEHRGSAYKKK